MAWHVACAHDRPEAWVILSAHHPNMDLAQLGTKAGLIGTTL